jgi:hypothetical protein
MTPSYTKDVQLKSATMAITEQTNDAVTGTLALPDLSTTVNLTGSVSAYSATGYMYLYLTGTNEITGLSTTIIMRLWLINHTTVGSASGTLGGIISGASPRMIYTTVTLKKQ